MIQSKKAIKRRKTIPKKYQLLNVRNLLFISITKWRIKSSFFVDDFVVLFKWTHAYLNKIAFHHRKKWRKLLKRKMRLYYQRIIFVSLTLFLLAFHYFHKKMEKFCFSRFHCTEKEYDYCKIRIKLHKKLPFALIYLHKKTKIIQIIIGLN